MTGGALLLIIILGLFPVGPALMSWLEHRYERPAELPDRIDGIIVLGGTVESALSVSLGHIALNGTSERLLCFTDLAKKYPRARKIFTGGSGDILNPEAREADIVQEYFTISGIPASDILYEKDSRNTYENAIFSKDLANPRDGQNWVLVTSAFHMPRSVGIFHQAAWHVIPYPCDFKTDSSLKTLLQPPDAANNYSLLHLAVREIVGLVVYKLTGKSAFVLPPRPVPSADE